MNVEEQYLILELFNESNKEIITSFLLKDSQNREEFKNELKKIISKGNFKDIDLEKIIDELIDLYNSLLKIARFKNTQTKSMEDFDRIMDNITQFINTKGKYNKDFLNIIIIGLKEQYNEISRLLKQDKNKEIIRIFRERYLNDFDESQSSKEDKIRYLKEISQEISKEVSEKVSQEVSEDEVFEILKEFIKHQTQFYNLTNLKIFSFLLNSKTINSSIYSRILLFKKLDKLNFEELKTNKDFIQLVEQVKEFLKQEKIEFDKDVIIDYDIQFICYLMIIKLLNSGIVEDITDFGGGNMNKKLIKEIQSFLKKYKNRNNDKLIKVLKQLNKI